MNLYKYSEGIYSRPVITVMLVREGPVKGAWVQTSRELMLAKVICSDQPSKSFYSEVTVLGLPLKQATKLEWAQALLSPHEVIRG